jgi:hypothetical protein
MRTLEPSATLSATPPPEPVSPLEGTWQTDPLSRSDAEATLRRFGLARWIERFRRVPLLGPRTWLILDIRDGGWNLYGSSGDGPREKIDFDAGYMVDGNEVDKIHAAGVTTFRWSVNGDTLTLEWLETTEPSFRGIPGEVFQRALYMAAEFERKG